MTDEELSKYVKKHGDRMAVRQFCQREMSLQTTPTPSALSKATANLMDTLRKRKMPASDGSALKSLKLTGNKNAEKEERRLELGCKHFDGKEFVQIRQQRGGGIRHLKGKKDVSMLDIQKTALDLFFPNGISSMGNVDNFDIRIADNMDDITDLSTTLNAQYELRKYKLMRLYLCTKRASCS